MNYWINSSGHLPIQMKTKFTKITQHTQICSGWMKAYYESQIIREENVLLCDFMIDKHFLKEKAQILRENFNTLDHIKICCSKMTLIK